MLLSLLLPMTPAPAIGLPGLRRLPPLVGPHNPPDDEGDDAEAHQVEEKGLAAGPREQRPGDEQRYANRNRRPLVPADEAANRHRDGFDLNESVPDAHKHLLMFANVVGKQGQRPAPDALRPGSDTATENAGWGLEKDAARPGSYAWDAAK